MKLQYVTEQDKAFWLGLTSHGGEAAFYNCVNTKTGYIMWEGSTPVGLMFYCVLWGNLPFLNLIFVKEEHRGKGYATQAMALWEQDMKKQGYKMVLTSTQVDETAQHFYRKLGYADCGGLILHNTPLEQPMELFLSKII